MRKNDPPKPTGHYTALTHLAGLNKEWTNLGLALGLDHGIIEEIESNHPGDVRKCVERIVEEWLKKRGKEPSWKILHEALTDELVRRPDIAEQINDRYLKPPSLGKEHPVYHPDTAEN